MAKFAKLGLLALGLSAALPVVQASAEAPAGGFDKEVIIGITRTIVVTPSTSTNGTWAEDSVYDLNH